MLILNGPQGTGKSTLFAKLAEAWFSDALSLTDMRDKTGAEKLQGYWILELGELAGMRKMDVETVKGFLSRGQMINSVPPMPAPWSRTRVSASS
ncbi:virulence-associated E family protein [Corynebacterium kutscheri]|nr:virulence-associated E family protein [Corynebacterium kutscheri]